MKNMDYKNYIILWVDSLISVPLSIILIVACFYNITNMSDELINELNTFINYIKIHLYIRYKTILKMNSKKIFIIKKDIKSCKSELLLT